MKKVTPSDLTIKRYPSIDLVGRAFGRLAVIEYAGFSKELWAAYWRCRCECGRDTLVDGRNLTKEVTKSCGCLAAQEKSVRSWKGCGDLSGNHYNHIKHRAIKSGLQFTISIEQLWRLYEAQNSLCAISKLPIAFGRYHRAERNRVHGTWARLDTASLDRIDNTRGYVIGNVQWVHKEVNRMKGCLPQTNFIELCTAIVEAGRHLKRRVAC